MVLHQKITGTLKHEEIKKEKKKPLSSPKAQKKVIRKNL